MTQPVPTDPDPTDALLARWRAGDLGARDAVLAHVLPWLRDETSKLIGVQHLGSKDSMDLVQTSVLKVMKLATSFVPANAADLRALLRRIVRNLVTDQRRRRGRGGGERHLESLANTDNCGSGVPAQDRSALQPSRAAESAEEQGLVELALQFLSDDDRYLLLASQVEGLDWSSIAVELGLPSPDTARMRCARLKPKVANLIRRLRAGQLPLAE